MIQDAKVDVIVEELHAVTSERGPIMKEFVRRLVKILECKS
jgi:hypothetical protein